MNLTERANRKTFVAILFLAVTASYCTLPLLLRQNLPYAQDIIFHVFQADQFNRAIHDGVVYPRWVLDSNNGYGSANFIFYSPLSYYFVSFITLLVPSLIVAMVIALWFGFFFSGLAMLVAARRFFGESGSLLSAMLYQILPFHVLDLYSRGSFAEVFAYIWFPLIFLYLHETLYPAKNRMASVALSVSYACLILTHLVSAFIMSLLIAGYLVYHLFRGPKGPCLKTSLSLLHGLGLSSVYLLPVLFERKLVKINAITNCPICDYKKNFLFTWDKIQARLAGFYAPLHIAVILEALLFLFILLSLRRLRQSSSNDRRENFFVFPFLAAFFLTTPLSAPLWKIVPAFPMLQFPWRWVSVMEVSLCFIVAKAFSFGDIAGLRVTAKTRMVLYLVAMLALASFFVLLKSETLPQRFVDRYLVPARIKTLVDPILEYTPIWARDIKTIMSEEENKRISVVSGSASTEVSLWQAERRRIVVKSSEPSTLRISTFYYPGWKASIDGRGIQIRIERGSGAMLLNIPEGEHTVELKFTDTPLRSFSKYVSLISFFAIILLAVVSRRRRDRTLPKE
jgi:hypothetical protein